MDGEYNPGRVPFVPFIQRIRTMGVYRARSDCTYVQTDLAVYAPQNKSMVNQSVENAGVVFAKGANERNEFFEIRGPRWPWIAHLNF